MSPLNFSWENACDQIGSALFFVFMRPVQSKKILTSPASPRNLSGNELCSNFPMNCQIDDILIVNMAHSYPVVI